MGINFVTKRDIHIMKEIEKHYHTEIKELPAHVVNSNWKKMENTNKGVYNDWKLAY